MMGKVDGCLMYNHYKGEGVVSRNRVIMKDSELDLSILKIS